MVERTTPSFSVLVPGRLLLISFHRARFSIKPFLKARWRARLITVLRVLLTCMGESLATKWRNAIKKDRHCSSSGSSTLNSSIPDSWLHDRCRDDWYRVTAPNPGLSCNCLALVMNSARWSATSIRRLSSTDITAFPRPYLNLPFVHKVGTLLTAEEFRHLIEPTLSATLRTTAKGRRRRRFRRRRCSPGPR